ncbi:TetR family transcriptional regulator [Sorangium cellulosum]|uniref:TetR family transcriptional regulator n=1 Tax=Sorangium cellulosum TaxID=56 RepID=A0A4P2Q4Q7_SORCE|nr:TetR/AcrR family transcriptional regulator [Sorangium cellulosum]AUX24384.1 TetR family transcriptional regulator [Sorangium cellulosum]
MTQSVAEPCLDDPSTTQPAPAPRRRTGARGARPGGRSERVVRAVMHAAAAELARAGYMALRIEDVAALAGVNKTTVYRRWPTKAELVKATLRSLVDGDGEAPDTGSLRLDLLELVRRIVAVASMPVGHGIYRVLLAELHLPEVEAFARACDDERFAPWREVLERAVARGELPPGSDLRLIIEMIRSPLALRLFQLREPVDDSVLQAVVDTVLFGAKNGGAVLRAASPGPPEPPATAAPAPRDPAHR